MTQSTPVANESGATTQPWRTPVVISNHSLCSPLARTQLTDCSYRDFTRWMILLGMPSLDKRSQRAGQLIESKADGRSTYAAYVGRPNSRRRCAIRFRVRMWSHVERPGMNPLCCCLQCASSTGRILAKRTCDS